MDNCPRSIGALVDLSPETHDSEILLDGRQLEPAEVDLLKAVRAHGANTRLAVETVMATPGIDKRAAAVAQTHLQTGLMWLRRAITRPEHY